jgi:hypothetical protein
MIKVISVDPIEDYKLRVEFSNGRKGVSTSHRILTRVSLSNSKTRHTSVLSGLLSGASCGPTNRISVLRR